MSCNADNLTVRVPCQRLESYRLQRQLLAQGLCAIADALVGGYTCDLAALTTPTTGLCMGESEWKQKQAQILQDGLDLDPDALNCYTPDQVEQIITKVLCTLITAANP
jgi:hypothetical protein